MMRKIFKDISGFTIIELFASMLISGILIWGLLMTYIYGIKSFNEISSRFQMINEGRAQLGFIENHIRRSVKIELTDNINPNRTRLKLWMPDKNKDGILEGTVEFFTNNLDGSLRYHNHCINKNFINVRLLPMYRLTRNNRDREIKYPYRIVKMHFQLGDDDVDDYDLHPGDPEFIVKIDMVLEDDYDNVVSLTSYQARMN